MLIKPLAWPAGCGKVDDNAKLFGGEKESETTARDAGYSRRAPGEGQESCGCCWLGRAALAWPPVQAGGVTNPGWGGRGRQGGEGEEGVQEGWGRGGSPAAGPDNGEEVGTWQ